LGANWHNVQDAFRYIEYVVVLALITASGWLLARRRSRLR
jgi:hypothetical protein